MAPATVAALLLTGCTTVHPYAARSPARQFRAAVCALAAHAELGMEWAGSVPTTPAAPAQPAAVQPAPSKRL
ncbi:hypothetical protein [Streptomyces albidoflavus]|uniref:hypothetical protein n=1 Tax=Streptomyces albidoflavus TaxID=1886 RepID=UPI001C450270|nr:hypothetical protein [Streptomyces albidoflavus]MBV7652724.1 hypothetical protein [Streptomyces albidoflavus]MBV7714193.1 hypothetical protein [Streptomyces albidoflavus]